MAHISDWTAIGGDEDNIAAELVARGPLSILINAETLQFHHSGIWDPLICSNATDHAVLLVGYGVQKGLTSSTPYWIVKNSWGTKWGEQGYFQMIRGKAKCGITTGVTGPIVASGTDTVVPAVVEAQTAAVGEVPTVAGGTGGRA